MLKIYYSGYSKQLQLKVTISADTENVLLVSSKCSQLDAHNWLHWMLKLDSTGCSKLCHKTAECQDTVQNLFSFSFSSSSSSFSPPISTDRTVLSRWRVECYSSILWCHESKGIPWKIYNLYIYQISVGNLVFLINVVSPCSTDSTILGKNVPSWHDHLITSVS